MNNNFKIDFIGIGVERAATSWIYVCLKEHPEIFLSWPKETFFFSSHRYDKGLQYYEQRFFKNWPKDKLIGEITPVYFQSKKAPALIKKHYPDAKLILCLRNPIDKLSSHYHFKKSRGKMPQPSIEQAIQSDELKEEIPKGFYYPALQNYLQHFPKENILIVLYEDISKDPTAFIQKIYKFLNVDSNFVPASIYSQVNAPAKDRLIVPGLTKNNIKKTTAILKKSWLGNNLIKLMKAAKIVSLISFLESRNQKANTTAFKKPMDKELLTPQTRQQLRRIYQDDIKQMEKFLKRDLSFWK